MIFSTTKRGRIGCLIGVPFAPLKLHMEFENQTLDKEIPIGNHHFRFHELWGRVMVYTNHQRTGLQLNLGSVFYW